jgi:hypothetical protein
MKIVTQFTPILIKVYLQNPLVRISFDDNFSSVRVIFDRKSYREQEKFH